MLFLNAEPLKKVCKARFKNIPVSLSVSIKVLIDSTDMILMTSKTCKVDVTCEGPGNSMRATKRLLNTNVELSLVFLSTYSKQRNKCDKCKKLINHHTLAGQPFSLDEPNPFHICLENFSTQIHHIFLKPNKANERFVNFGTFKTNICLIFWT